MVKISMDIAIALCMSTFFITCIQSVHVAMVPFLLCFIVSAPCVMLHHHTAAHLVV